MPLKLACGPAVPARPNRAVRELHRLSGALTRGAGLLAPIAVRVALAVPFLRSGLTKWSGWFRISPVADVLFASIFKLHLFGHQYGFPMPVVLAHLDAVAEIVLPMLLIVGLATRLSALGLLIMTGVIQLTVPSGWVNFHLAWAALALTLVALGGGPLSTDYVIERWLGRPRLCARRQLAWRRPA
jgi:putative oxidoreductase